MAVILSSDTELLERTAELDALEAAFAAVGRSGGRLVLVAGEAGVGKTVLLRRFAARAVPPLWGDCDALFTLSPLGPLVDIAATTGVSSPTVSRTAPRRM
jgi:predicted ATPase